MKDPELTIYTIEILRPSLKEAQDLAETLQKLPQVDHVLTLGSFVPRKDQEAELDQIGDAGMYLPQAYGRCLANAGKRCRDF